MNTNMPNSFADSQNAGSVQAKKPSLQNSRLSLAFFLVSIPFLEVILRIANTSVPLFGAGLFRSLLSGAALGVLILLIATAIPWYRPAYWITAILFFLTAVCFIAECCCQDFFGTYYQISFLLNMSGEVAGNFLATAFGVIGRHLWFFPLALAPCLISLLFGKKLIPHFEQDKRSGKSRRLITQAVLFLILQIMALLVCRIGDDRRYATIDYSANSAVMRFGLVNTMELELYYGIFGAPELDLGSDPSGIPMDASNKVPLSDTETASGEDIVPATETATETLRSEPVLYEDQIMDIDFDALLAADTDSTLKSMDEYFSGQTPTKKNAYTGLFQGKNLIMLTAESFSYVAIDKERTPALYELANNGFVFTNYYQPDWSQSTTGGEFAAMTGIIPTWVNGKTSFSVSANQSMPYGLGWMFRSMGYSATAYHNNTYSYYHRSETHPNLGYDYYGFGNGLTLESASSWPASDLEMLQATIGEPIDNYVRTGTPFHTYYMTVSGHCDYKFSLNAMSKKNRDAVSGLDYSEPALAYLASQMELEYALEYLLDELEAAGIAEDTVIVLTADHFPYALSEDYDSDYYKELTGIDDTESMTSRYKNTLILWSGSMKEPVPIDAPCSAIDIVPTLLNLFGMKYDSRLLSGRDILAPDITPGMVDSGMKIVPFVDFGFGCSWITAAGTYEAYTKTFTPNPGVTVDEDYVSKVNALVRNKETYAKYLISENYYHHVFPEWNGSF